MENPITSICFTVTCCYQYHRENIHLENPITCMRYGYLLIISLEVKEKYKKACSKPKDLKMDGRKNSDRHLKISYFAASALVIFAFFSYGLSPIKAETFACGQDICNKGYTVCISPPLVLTQTDSYCIPCEQFEGTCGTADQQNGCHLYCRDLITKELRTANTKIQNLEQEKSVLEKVNKDLTAGLVASVCFDVVLLTGIFVLIWLYRRRCEKCVQRNSDESQSLSSSDSAATHLLSTSSGSSATSITTQKEKTGDSIEEKNDTSKDTENGSRKDVQSDCYGDNKLHNVNPVQSENKSEMAVK
ncbi:uncharacterized protein LOC128552955 [Mercenaria mercenaria]|uniref:uncharacterized protein LOC128552955 n=1 Tax=Mercenaria mercenaria TaxID=6596 RepID=UPI00234F8F8B|nr:uncharacterized protein LOC128552955 [Mercenaria mercenaria]